MKFKNYRKSKHSAPFFDGGIWLDIRSGAAIKYEAWIFPRKKKEDKDRVISSNGWPSHVINHHAYDDDYVLKDDHLSIDNDNRITHLFDEKKESNIKKDGEFCGRIVERGGRIVAWKKHQYYCTEIQINLKRHLFIHLSNGSRMSEEADDILDKIIKQPKKGCYRNMNKEYFEIVELAYRHPTNSRYSITNVVSDSCFFKYKDRVEALNRVDWLSKEGLIKDGYTSMNEGQTLKYLTKRLKLKANYKSKMNKYATSK